MSARGSENDASRGPQDDGESDAPKSRPKQDGGAGPAEKRTSSLPTPLDAFGAVESAWGYPAFARDFPRHAELDELVAAFARGDYRSVRERAPQLAQSASDPAVKRAAELLRERIEPDKSSKVLFLLAGLLLAFLTSWWVAHDGPEEKAVPARSP